MILGDDFMQDKYGRTLADLDFDASDDDIAEKISTDAMEISMTKYLTPSDIKKGQVKSATYK